MDKNVFQDRQHISVNRLNQIYGDLETYLSDVFNETLPLAGTVIGTGMLVTATSPTSYAVDIPSGTAYDPSIFRIEFPIDATPAPYVLTWADNATGSGNRNDIVYATGVGDPDDLITAYFMGQAGNIYAEPIYQRQTQTAQFSVAIGTVYSGTFSTANDPVVPSNAVKLARVWNHAGATVITGPTDTGFNAFVQDIRNIYPFTFSGAMKLENLADVEINLGTLADGQTIRWNAAASAWENANDLEGPTPVSFTASSSISGPSAFNFSVTHDLGFYPLIQIFDNASPPNEVIPDAVQQNCLNQFTVGFSSAFSGTIIFK